MLFNHTTFLGIDPTLSHNTEPGQTRTRDRRAFVYAALNQEGHLIALGEGSLEDVLAFAGGQENAYVAVSAPRRPNQGLMTQESLREQLVPPPKPGRWMEFRLAEYLLRQRQIGMTPTPGREEDCPGWMRSAFHLYQRLESFGFCPYPTADAPLQWLEVHPHACFSTLLGQSPFPKHSLEGRLQRQLVLYQQGLKIPDPMVFFEEITPFRLLRGSLPLKNVYTPEELDALAAAYTAWIAGLHPEQITLLGAPEEGQVALPIPEVKTH